VLRALGDALLCISTDVDGLWCIVGNVTGTDGLGCILCNSSQLLTLDAVRGIGLCDLDLVEPCNIDKEQQVLECLLCGAVDLQVFDCKWVGKEVLKTTVGLITELKGVCAETREVLLATAPEVEELKSLLVAGCISLLLRKSLICLVHLVAECKSILLHSTTKTADLILTLSARVRGACRVGGSVAAVALVSRVASAAVTVTAVSERLKLDALLAVGIRDLEVLVGGSGTGLLADDLRQLTDAVKHSTVNVDKEDDEKDGNDKHDLEHNADEGWVTLHTDSCGDIETEVELVVIGIV